MFWGRFSNRGDGPRWRFGIGPWEIARQQPSLDEREELRIDPSMSEAEIDNRLRLRIELRRKLYRDFFGHLVVFVGVNIVLWSVWGVNIASGTDPEALLPWPLFVTLFWGVGLIAQGYQLYQTLGAGAARREQALQREIERERARFGLERVAYEKPKRGRSDNPAAADWPEKVKRSSSDTQAQRVRLSDDGELIPLEPSEAEEVPLPRQSAQQQD